MNAHLPMFWKKVKRPASVAQAAVAHRHPEAGWVIAWTDGAVEPNPGWGGWGYRLEHPDLAAPIEGYGGEPDTTNNRMELLAIIEAVTAVPRQFDRIIVRTDSQLCVLCGIGLWAKKANVDLWGRLDDALEHRQMVYEWWRGHAGTPGNERADELAAIGRELAMGDAATSHLSSIMRETA